MLDGCAAFLASGSKDTDKLIAAHGNRAIGFSATGNYDAALAELNEAGGARSQAAEYLFHARGGL